MRPSESPFAVYRHALSEAAARDAYAALAAASPLASAFSGLSLAARIGEAFGLGVSLLSVRRPDAPPATWEAGMVAFDKRRGPFRALALPPLLPMTGPLVRALPSEADTHAGRSPLGALAAFLYRRYDQATLAPAPGLTDARAFAWAGFSVGLRYTYRLALSADTVAGWAGNARRVLARHAGAYDVAEAPGGVRTVLSLTEQSYARQGARLGLPRARVLRLADALVRSGDARLFTATSVGTEHAEAAAIFVRHGAHAAYWLSGSTPGPAMTVLFARALPALAGSGVRWLDLNGANVPGIAEFKRKLGADLVPVLRIRQTRHPVLRALAVLRSP